MFVIVGVLVVNVRACNCLVSFFCNILPLLFGGLEIYLRIILVLDKLPLPVLDVLLFLGLMGLVTV